MDKNIISRLKRIGANDAEIDQVFEVFDESNQTLEIYYNTLRMMGRLQEYKSIDANTSEITAAGMVSTISQNLSGLASSK